MFSGGASGGRYLKSNNSPHYRVIVGLTDNPEAAGIEKLDELGVKVEIVDKKGSLSQKDKKGARYSYFSRLANRLEKYNLQTIVLSGFMQVLTNPLLKEYYPRIINVHPADLTIEEAEERKYKGDDSVFDAINSGESYLRSSVHIVTKEIDQGPLLVLSRKFPVKRDLISTLREKNPRLIRDYSDILQEWMKWKGDGPSLAAALNLIGKGQIALKGNETFIKKNGEFINGFMDLEEGRIVPKKD